MLFDRFGVHQHIVKVHQNTTVKQIEKNIVHHTLESGWCRSESEWHNRELVCAIATSETCFHLVAHMHGYLVISIAHVKLTKDARTI